MRRGWRVVLVALAALAAPTGLSAQGADPLEKVKQSIRLKQFKAAQTQLEGLAAAGNADAQYLLAAFYLNGLNGPREADRARPWLEKAAAQGNAAAIRSLKALSATENASGVAPLPAEAPPSDPAIRREALWLAIRHGDVQSVRSMVDRASVNYLDDFGRGALARAAEEGSPEIVEILVHAGATVDRPDAFGITPLMLAARTPHGSTVAALLRAGADVGLTDHVGNTALMHAAAAGDVAALQQLLSAGANINAHNAQGWSARDFADWASAPEAVRLLSANGGAATRRSHAPTSASGVLHARTPEKDLYAGWDDVAIAASRRSPALLETLSSTKSGGNPDTPDGASALMVAVRSDAPQSLERLLAKGGGTASGAGPALLLAARSGSVEVGRILLAHGVSPDSRSTDGEPAIVAAARAGHSDIVRLLLFAHGNPALPDRHGTSALMLAAQNSNDEMIRSLLDAGAPVQAADKSGRTALWYAAHGGYLTGTTLLLEHGANVDQADAAGVSALATACRAGSAAVAERLLSGNARIEARTSQGDTPLLLAAAAGHLSIVDRLLGAHADKDVQNEFGDTALIIASRNGDVALVKRLLAAGANTRVRNHDRATAADIAAARSFHDVLALLQG